MKYKAGMTCGQILGTHYEDSVAEDQNHSSYIGLQNMVDGSFEKGFKIRSQHLRLHVDIQTVWILYLSPLVGKILLLDSWLMVNCI